MNVRLDWLQREVPSLKHALRMEQIMKGFSQDEKYRIEMGLGEKRLLRVAKLEQWEQKKAEYEVLQTMQSYNVNASAPIALGRIEDRDICYMLLSYVEGEDARDVLPSLSEREQYDIGYHAGQDLARMHQLAASPRIPLWYDRCVHKHQKYVAAYHQSQHKIKHASHILAFIENHLAYIKDRPNRFLHDDFHVGNLIVHKGRYAGVIDFNRYDWGDPVHEFTKLAFFSKEISVPFCQGQLRGYFQQSQVPASFWILYSLYTATAIFSSIVWTERVAPALVDEMIERVEQIVEEHKAFERTRPDWYVSEENESNKKRNYDNMS